MPSCSTFSLSQYTNIYSVAKDTVFDANVLEVSAQEYDAFNYSFAKVKIGRSGIAIMTLAGIENDIFTWISSSGEKLQTVNGKIIKISGSPFDFELFV